MTIERALSDRRNEATQEEAVVRSYTEEIRRLLEAEEGGRMSAHAILTKFRLEDRANVSRALSLMANRGDLETTGETVFIDGQEYPVYIRTRFIPPSGFVEKELGGQ